MTTQPDNTAVWFPQLTPYALAGGAGYLFDRRWPLPVPHDPLVTVTAVALIIAWLLLAGMSISRFRQSRTNIFRIQPASALVQPSAHRFTRGAMHAGLAFLTIDVGILLGTWWPTLLLVPTLLVAAALWFRRRGIPEVTIPANHVLIAKDRFAQHRRDFEHYRSPDIVPQAIESMTTTGGPRTTSVATAARNFPAGCPPVR